MCDDICSICNGLTKLLLTCPRCQTAMTDQGALTDYTGPYAPYRRTPEEPAARRCLHLVDCADCGNSRVVAVPLLPER